jgi:phosphatidylglycerol lysyltransferase
VIAKNSVLRMLGPLAGIFLLIAALWALHNNLSRYRYHDIVASLSTISDRQIALAVALTMLSYLILSGYDLLAVRYVNQKLPWRKVSFAAAISYAFSNTIGLSVLTSGSVRYRLYSQWGLTSLEIAKVVMFCALTLWLGILTIGSLILILEPLPASLVSRLPFASGQLLGWLMLILVLGYLLLTSLRREPLQIRNWAMDIPAPYLAALQLLVGMLDWVTAGAVLYVLLPPGSTVDFAHFLAVFLTAQTIGLVSHIPGGLGVFESLIVLLLPAEVSAAAALSALVVYRIIYYLLPLLAASLTFGLYEAMRQRQRVLWLPRFIAPWIPILLPQVFALMALINGAVLLFSAATPAVPSRMSWLTEIVPLSLVEASHFISSLVGTGLLLLARSLQQRLDAAYLMTLALLAIGIVISLLKGADYEEAAALAVMLAALLPCRREFYRKASLIDQRFTAGWITTITVVLVCAAWLGFFSYKHVEYSNTLWWQFSFSHIGDASRFLRAMVGTLVTVMFFAIARLLRPAPVEHALPSQKELAVAKTVIANSRHTYAHLALLGDKSLLFNPSGTAFIMYGIEGRAWIAMGDPVGSPEERRELAWQYRELCEYHNGWTVFYQVRLENLDIYLELGLTLLKIGEEARVSLAEFSLVGKHRKSLRGSVNRLEKEGCHFEVIQAEEVPALLPQLKYVSDAWLAGKNTREKCFSLGFFQRDYLASCPLALVRRDEKIIAFANLWLGGTREELSLDLMRYLSDTPPGIMDYLFVKLMLWGREQGYAWFNLGMAPLAGLQSRNLAPIWNRFGALVFGHGERFYNFQGVHQFKNKFDPLWEPRYLAVPSGITLPRILTNLSTLIAGGLPGVIRK